MINPQLNNLHKSSISSGGHLNGRRIGFDAGGSDIKISAVVDGNVIHSQEIVWLPKLNQDPNYHFTNIYNAMKTSEDLGRSNATFISDITGRTTNKDFDEIIKLYVSDEKKMVDVGTGSIWYSIYSTAAIAFSDDAKKSIPFAMEFLKSGECPLEKVEETRKQMLAVRQAFSDLEPDKAVYDLHKPDLPPPWHGNIASTVTSCANLYTTADGKDLFTEVLALLDYAAEKKLSISAG